jgi:hypothetical protein
MQVTTAAKAKARARWRPAEAQRRSIVPGKPRNQGRLRSISQPPPDPVGAVGGALLASSIHRRSVGGPGAGASTRTGPGRGGGGSGTGSSMGQQPSAAAAPSGQAPVPQLEHQVHPAGLAAHCAAGREPSPCPPCVCCTFRVRRHLVVTQRLFLPAALAAAVRRRSPRAATPTKGRTRRRSGPSWSGSCESPRVAGWPWWCAWRLRRWTSMPAPSPSAIRYGEGTLVLKPAARAQRDHTRITRSQRFVHRDALDSPDAT